MNYVVGVLQAASTSSIREHSVMSIVMTSYVRRPDGSFVEICSASRCWGDSMHVPGAISLKVDGVELFGLDLWDDVNWLWSLFIQTIVDRRVTGSGKRGFPDQPIAICADRAWDGHTLLRVTDGDAIDRSAVASDNKLFAAVAMFGLEFFREFRRLCPGDVMGQQEQAILESWIDDGPHQWESVDG